MNKPVDTQAQQHGAPGTGRRDREIKALSEDQLTAYLEGRGMELALVAELNHYPGPLHTLELAEPLQLTAAQKSETERLRAAVLDEARKLGRLIVDKEKELDELFAGGNIDDDGLRTTVREIARMKGELRIAHLRRHLEMKRILTPEQVDRYDELRGHTQGSAEHTARQHGKQ